MTEPRLFDVADVTVDTTQTTLQERFGVPPFTVLDGRQGYWQDRKRAWLSLGIQSEVGRDANLVYSRSLLAHTSSPTIESGTSIFDPVICELVYRWFCPPGALILDPFAGGSVRGIVAAILGHHYVGVDLRPEQVAANEAQADDLLGDAPGTALWVCGDSAQVIPDMTDRFDFVFSCPPYFDLEKYSDDPADLSNARGWDDFCRLHGAVIKAACDRLRPDRFAAWVTGDIRDQAGNLRGLPAHTTDAFRAAGVAHHNDALLLSPIGSMAVRATRGFPPNRRLVRGHQYLGVYVKGDANRAATACGTVEMGDLASTLYGTADGVLDNGHVTGV